MDVSTKHETFKIMFIFIHDIKLPRLKFVNILSFFWRKISSQSSKTSFQSAFADRRSVILIHVTLKLNWSCFLQSYCYYILKNILYGAAIKYMRKIYLIFKAKNNTYISWTTDFTKTKSRQFSYDYQKESDVSNKFLS